MKLQPDQMDTLAVTGYDREWIAVNGVRHTSSLFLSAQGLLKPWVKTHFEQLGDSDLEELLALKAGHRAHCARLGHQTALFNTGLAQNAARPAPGR